MNTYSRNVNRHVKSESGQAFFELVLTFPFILFLSLGGLELSRELRTIQIATSISLGIASTAYKNCAFEVGSKADEEAGLRKSLPQSCLETVLQDWQPQITNMAPGSRVILSTFRNQNGAASNPGSANNGTSLAGSSKFTFNAGAKTLTGPTTDLSSTLANHNYIVIAEIYVPYQRLFQLRLPGFALADVTTGTLYDATII